MNASQRRVVRNPFQSVIPTSDFFPSEHQKTISAVLSALKQDSTVLLSGPAGCGISTAVRQIAVTSNDTCVHIRGMQLPSSDDIYQVIFSSLGTSIDATDRCEVSAEAINDALRKKQDAGESIVLLIDDAHLLSTNVLAELPAVVSQEFFGQLFRLVLAGTDVLKDMLRRPAVDALKQLVSQQFEIQPFSQHESANFISYQRDRIAGATNSSFEDSAIQHIAAVSGGLPRCINLLCDACLCRVNDGEPVTQSVVVETFQTLKHLPYGWNHEGTEPLQHETSAKPETLRLWDAPEVNDNSDILGSFESPTDVEPEPSEHKPSDVALSSFQPWTPAGTWQRQTTVETSEENSEIVEDESALKLFCEAEQPSVTQGATDEETVMLQVLFSKYRDETGGAA